MLGRALRAAVGEHHDATGVALTRRTLRTYPKALVEHEITRGAVIAYCPTNDGGSAVWACQPRHEGECPAGGVAAHGENRSPRVPERPASGLDFRSSQPPP